MDELLKLLQGAEPIAVGVLAWMVYQLMAQIKTLVQYQHDVLMLLLKDIKSEEELAAEVKRGTFGSLAIKKHYQSEYD